MKTRVVMPQLGESIVEGTVSRWLKKAGDVIAEYEALVEVSTDKVDTEIPSPAAGVILQIYVDEGQTVETGTLLAEIGEPGEKPESDSQPSHAPHQWQKQRSLCRTCNAGCGAYGCGT